MSAYEVTVVVPCFNESANLRELTERLERVFEKKKTTGEIILVNDGSRDDTGAVIDALAAQRKCVVAVHHPVNRGIEAGWSSGLARARGEYVCFIDADLQYLPEDVWRLYREIRLTHADLVQGYRSSIGRLKDSRYILSKGLNFLLNALFGMSQRDNKSGFVIALRETMADILHHRYRYRYFQSFITVAAKAKGYTIREIETIFESRLLGRSFIPLLPTRMIVLSMIDIVKGLIEFRLAPKRESLVADFLRANVPPRRDPPLTGWRKALFWLYLETMPLHTWMITKRVKLYYDELKQSQWLTPAQIRELQERKLRRLIHHAYHHVGYYRERMDALGLKPQDIVSLDDIAKLPLLDKANVRENLYFDLLSDNHDKRWIQKTTTSGSTGEPFVCYADQHQLEIRWAATLRSVEWTGYRFGDRQARLWHQTIGMTWPQVLKERLDALLARRLFFPAFEMTEANIERFVQGLRRFKPALIDGYAESFNYLASHLKRRQIEGVHPRGIISSAQVLPDDSRAAIESAFGARVFDKYGSREFSGIAYECEAHAGHHVVGESFIVEILRENRPAAPGELGEVVVTDLNNFCLPFIRYRLGDLAVALDPREACPCGRGLPRLGRIEGRVQSIILGADRAIPSSLFYHLLKDYDHIVRQFQVFQDQPGRVVLRVVKASRFEERAFEAALNELRRYLGQATRIDVEFMETIPMVRTGKRQISLSTMKIDFQKLDKTPQL